MNTPSQKLLERYKAVRQVTENICSPLQESDYQLQPSEDVSPAKWHLAHTTWFFETFILQSFLPDYQPYNASWAFLHNSYYEHAGKRILRNQRGSISRPSVGEIYEYRKYIDQKISGLLHTQTSKELEDLMELGCQHEQQHQELLYTDIQYSLSINPIFPVYKNTLLTKRVLAEVQWIAIPEGIYTIGYQGADFCFDNELGVHKQFIEAFEISKQVVSVGEYLEFIEAGGYEKFEFWLSEGWGWVKNNEAKAPLYWHLMEGQWFFFTLGGLIPLEKDLPLAHVNYFEADAFARWKGQRLPTEFEWEVAQDSLDYGQVWEWTQSAYLPYPRFKIAEGALGEYNGKWMVSQMVLRGGSVASPAGHVRPTYRNFFHPDKQWQFTGIRLVK